jgi:hypothetical protein
MQRRAVTAELPQSMASVRCPRALTCEADRMCRDLTNSAKRRVGSEPPAAARTSVYQFALVVIKNTMFSTSCVIAYRRASVLARTLP